MHNTPHTEETKAKMSAARLGKANPKGRRPTIIVNGITLYRCGICLNFLEASDFYKTKRTILGLTYDCRKCHMKVSAETRNPDNTRRLGRESTRRTRLRSPEVVRARERRAQRSRAKDEKYQARVLLNSAVKSGKVVKPSKCQRCGQTRKLSGHHHDYSKPLDVEWICYECHGKEHRKT